MRQFIIKYETQARSGVYVRREFFDERHWTKELQEATLFESATEAAQYMMKMGPTSSHGGKRLIHCYSIISVEAQKPQPVPLIITRVIERV